MILSHSRRAAKVAEKGAAGDKENQGVASALAGKVRDTKKRPASRDPDASAEDDCDEAGKGDTVECAWRLGDQRLGPPP